MLLIKVIYKSNYLHKVVLPAPNGPGNPPFQGLGKIKTRL